MSRDYYETLGVDRVADPATIKKAFRDLSMQHHPDKGGDAEKFKEINEAYSTLGNPEKRESYDNPMRNMGNPFGNIFSRFGGSFGGRQQRPDPNAPRRGRNIVLEKEISLRYFIFGGKLKVESSFRDACPECSGTGAEEKETCKKCQGFGQIMESYHDRGMSVNSSRPCPECGGRGFISSKACEFCEGVGNSVVDKKLELEVPVGIREGQVIGAMGEGGVGLNGGPPGDFVVKIYMKMPNLDELTEEQRKVLEEI